MSASTYVPEAGSDLLEELKTFVQRADLDSGQHILVVGNLANATLQTAPRMSRFHVPTPCFLVGAIANSWGHGWQITGAVSYGEDGDPKMVGGLFLKGEVAQVRYQVIPDPTSLASPHASDTPEAVMAEQSANGNEAMPQPTQPTTGWSAAVAQSSDPRPNSLEASWPSTGKTQQPGDRSEAAVGQPIDLKTLRLGRGDRLKHHTFGFCTVIKAAPNGRIKARKEDGGFLFLHLKAFDVFSTGADEDGHQQYDLRPKET